MIALKFGFFFGWINYIIEGGKWAPIEAEKVQIVLLNILSLRDKIFKIWIEVGLVLKES